MEARVFRVCLLPPSSSPRSKMKRLFTKRSKTPAASSQAAAVEATPAHPTPLAPPTLTTGVTPYTSPPQSPAVDTPLLIVRPQPTYATPSPPFTSAASNIAPALQIPVPAPYPTPPVSQHGSHVLSQSQRAMSPQAALQRAGSSFGGAASPAQAQQQAQRTVNDVSRQEMEGKLSVG